MRPPFFLILAALVLIGPACAYYNTFHSARKYFRDAEEQFKASGQEHPSPSVLDLYSRSIDRSEKVLIEYPKSKWVDDARLLIGMAYLRREEYEKGMATFEELIERHPKSKLIPDARFGIGLCQLGGGDWEAGRQTLEQLLQENPDYKRRAEARYQLAENAAQRRDYRSAVVEYTSLLASEDLPGIAPDRVYRARGEAYLALDAPDSALADFEEAVRLSNVQEDRYEARLLAGESLEEMGRLDEAFALYSQLEREMPGLKELPRTLLRKARVLNALGRHEEAIAVYERVIKDFPSSSYAAESLYQIGFTQEIYIGNLDAAKEAYGKVRETAPGSEFTTLAEERKQAIDLYGQYRSEMTTGGEEEKKAEAALMLAEVALFRLRKVDEALAAYEAVERDHPGSALAPKAAYAVAWIQEHELGDSLAAADSYRRVYESYPDTEYGVEAGVRAGLLAADSLSIYRGRVLQIKAVADSLVALALARAAAARGDSLAAISDSLASTPGDPLRAGPPDSAFGGADSLMEFQRVQMAPDRGVSPASPRVESSQDAPSSVREDSLAPPAMPPGVLPGPADGSPLPPESMPVTPPESMPPESTSPESPAPESPAPESPAPESPAPESTTPPEPTSPDSAGTSERGPE